VFLRTDLPVSQQAIQAGHAALELGLKHGPSLDGHPSLVYLDTSNKQELEAALDYVHSQGLKTYEFHEPYQDWGLTAFAVEPLEHHQRSIFSHFKLWRK
jgi:hypothetical protein